MKDIRDIPTASVEQPPDPSEALAVDALVARLEAEGHHPVFVDRAVVVVGRCDEADRTSGSGRTLRVQVWGDPALGDYAATLDVHVGRYGLMEVYASVEGRRFQYVRLPAEQVRGARSGPHLASARAISRLIEPLARGQVWVPTSFLDGHGVERKGANIRRDVEAARLGAEVKAALDALIAYLEAHPEPAGFGAKVRVRTNLVPGDIGEIVRLHGVLYAASQGWDETFEAYVAGPLSEFAIRKSPRERIWLVDADAELAGSVAIVEASPREAQLRWLLLSPRLRGRGIGRDLMQRAIAFAREQGYERIFLWTVDALVEAGRLYRSLGFVVTETVPGTHWGKDVVEQRYELVL